MAADAWGAHGVVEVGILGPSLGCTCSSGSCAANNSEKVGEKRLLCGPRLYVGKWLVCALEAGGRLDPAWIQPAALGAVLPTVPQRLWTPRFGNTGMWVKAGMWETAALVCWVKAGTCHVPVSCRLVCGRQPLPCQHYESAQGMQTQL
jgi:hypothetical protein